LATVFLLLPVAKNWLNHPLVSMTKSFMPNIRHLCAIFLSLAACCLTQCTPPDAPKAAKPDTVNLDLRNPLAQKLYTFRDERKSDSLLLYLSDKDATLRYMAALSFASVRDTNAIEPLAQLLRDAVEDVRIAAAFSLGQIGAKKCEKHLIGAFISDDPESQHQRFNAVVLEAIGKCGSRASLRHIASVSTYLPTDTLLLEGQCRAVFRFGQRDSVQPIATQLMVNYVHNDRIPEPARMVAACYLARTNNLTFDSTQAELLSAAFIRAPNNADIRIFLARALGRSQTGPAFGRLSKVIATEQDWRVKCSIINALAKFNYDTVRALLVPFIRDANPHVNRTAAEFFIANGQPQDGDYYWRVAQGNPDLPMLTQIALYRASNKFLSLRNEPESKFTVNNRLKQIFQQAKTPYERAACLGALSEFGWNYKEIRNLGFNNPHPAVKTAAAEALTAILQRPNFYSFFGENAKTVRRDLYYYLREIVVSGDPGMIASAADGFRVEALNYKTFRDSSRIGVLKTALAKLQMPRDVEAYMALDKAIAYFEGRPEPLAPKIAFNHPIDWTQLKSVTQQTEATIETTKGNIVLQLYPQWAPGSVINFISLANEGFYNGKAFHRVVPAFVIQGGCPRGDGYGALDYTLRTEIGLAWYDSEGYLGMASAGADTEGTQFFITHSATPHLGGRYTIFGKVKSGMDVVHQIQPGDAIKTMTVRQ